MPITLNGDTGIVTPMYNGGIAANAVTPSVNMKNRIINGAMVIDQRNAGASVTVTGSGQYPVDRFLCAKDTSGATVTAQQSSVVPANFRNSLLWTTSTGSSPAAGDDNILRQFIEGFNFADLGFGTASAQSFTLSFWVRSSVTGTYGVGFANSAANRAYMGTYTINAANTWEQKTVTVVGDTSGTWVTDSGIGLRVLWDMGSGSSRSIAASSAWGSSYGTGLTGGVKLVQTTGATFYITGVQLEVGSTATSFDYRPYGTELALCQRYFVGFPANSIFFGYSFTTTTAVYTVPLSVSMRTTPTSASVPANFDCRNGGNGGTTPSAVDLSTASNYILAISSTSTGFTTGQGSRLTCNSANALTLSAEL